MQNNSGNLKLPELCAMPLAGLEPARGEPLDFESSASANSATAACAIVGRYDILLLSEDRSCPLILTIIKLNVKKDPCTVQSSQTLQNSLLSFLLFGSVWLFHLSVTGSLPILTCRYNCIPSHTHVRRYHG